MVLAPLDIALSSAEFRKVNNLQISAEQLTQLRQEMYHRLGQHSSRLASSRDALNATNDIARLVQARTGLSQTATILEYVAAAANGLDDYSAYLTADQLREVYEQIEGNFVG